MTEHFLGLNYSVPVLIGLVANLVAIFHAFRKRRSRKRKNFLIGSAFLIVLISGIIFLVQENDRLKDENIVRREAYDKLSELRNDLKDLIEVYQNSYNSETGAVTNQRNSIKTISDATNMLSSLNNITQIDSMLSLTIYKLNIESYTYVIMSSAIHLNQLDGHQPLRIVSMYEGYKVSATETLDRLLNKLSFIENEYQTHSKYSALHNFLVENKYFDRARYLLAWAYAVKYSDIPDDIQHRTERINVRIHVIQELNNISQSYLEEYPIQDNYFLHGFN